MGLLRHLWNRNYCTSLLIIRRARGAPRKKSWGRHSPFTFLHTNCRTDCTYRPRLYRSWWRGGRAHFYLDNREHDLDFVGLCWMTILTLPYFNFLAGSSTELIRFPKRNQGIRFSTNQNTGCASHVPYLLQHVPYLLQHVPYLIL